MNLKIKQNKRNNLEINYYLKATEQDTLTCEDESNRGSRGNSLARDFMMCTRLQILMLS
jgi:hypothetical protein